MLTIRPPRADDAETLGRICYEAFGSLSGTHGFPNDFPSAEVASGLLGVLLGHPGFYSVVAEADRSNPAATKTGKGEKGKKSS